MGAVGDRQARSAYEPCRDRRIAPVSFVNGFCFATRAAYLRRVYPIATDINLHGWGPDATMGYFAAIEGGITVVDDRIVIGDSDTQGYDYEIATRQYRAWLRRMPRPVRIFHRHAHRIGIFGAESGG